VRERRRKTLKNQDNRRETHADLLKVKTAAESFMAYLRADARAVLFGDRSELAFAEFLIKRSGGDVAGVREAVTRQRELLWGELLCTGLSDEEFDRFIGEAL
jgi:hypothetical protein